VPRGSDVRGRHTPITSRTGTERGTALHACSCSCARSIFKLLPINARHSTSHNSPRDIPIIPARASLRLHRHGNPRPALTMREAHRKSHRRFHSSKQPTTKRSPPALLDHSSPLLPCRQTSPNHRPPTTPFPDPLHTRVIDYRFWIQAVTGAPKWPITAIERPMNRVTQAAAIGAHSRSAEPHPTASTGAGCQLPSSSRHCR